MLGSFLDEELGLDAFDQRTGATGSFGYGSHPKQGEATRTFVDEPWCPFEVAFFFSSHMDPFS